MNAEKSHAGHAALTAHAGGRALKISAWLTSVYFVIELAIGLYTGFVAVISDAFHTFSAVGGIVLAIVAGRTFGSYRAEIVGALLNGVFLLITALARISHHGHGLRCRFGAADARRTAKSVSGHTVEPSDAAGGRRNATRRAGRRRRRRASNGSADVPASPIAVLLLRQRLRAGAGHVHGENSGLVVPAGGNALGIGSVRRR